MVKEGRPADWSMSMLTVNADGHPLMGRMHKPGDETRSVVMLEEDQWEAWLDAKAEADVRSFLRHFDAEIMTARAEPKEPQAKG